MGLIKLGTNSNETETASLMSKSSLALSNLRAVVIVIVLAFHSCLAYLVNIPQPVAFNQAPYTWEAFPIADAHRWLGFDIFCATQDVSLMALMFFLSGLLTGPSLERKGARVYLFDRLRRIGLPFVLAVAFLSPISLYPAFAVRATSSELSQFWQSWLSLPFWPTGPEWFLWQLLVLNLMAVGLYALWPALLRVCRGFADWAGTRPLQYFAVLSGVAILAYAPLAFVYSPWQWQEFGPFGLQLCRPLIYILVFFAGFALGSRGIGHGLLSIEGPLARQWLAWTCAALLMFFVWAGLTSLTMPDWQSAGWMAKIASALTYPPACIAGGLFMLAVFLRFSRRRSWVLDSLSANAYGMYLVHYVFVVWLQYLLLPADLNALTKAFLVFAGSMALSWSASAAFNRLIAASEAVAAKRPVWTVSR
jgi:surface polysaccharide O-acyltransferase-like enzyme